MKIKEKREDYQYDNRTTDDRNKAFYDRVKDRIAVREGTVQTRIYRRKVPSSTTDQVKLYSSWGGVRLKNHRRDTDYADQDGTTSN